MRWRLVLSALIPLVFMSASKPGPQQAIIEHTGSTNMPGVKIVVDPSGTAEVQPRNEPTRKTTIDTQLSERLFHDLKAAGPLSAIPPVHCMKSVSFGSSIYIEFNGERSPDLNCPAPPDSKIGMLKKDVEDLMDAAHANPRLGHRFSATLPPK